MERKNLSRREFLQLAALTGAGMVLAACGGKPTEAPATQESPGAGPTAAPAAKDPTPFLFWFQAENHKPEYDRRQSEIEQKFNLKISYEMMSRDAMTQKFPATLMAGSGFPDIIEQNADDVVKFLKGDDSIIPFVDLKPALQAGPYANEVLTSRFDRYSKDGKYYGAPHDVHPVVMLYHDRAWKEFGIDMATVDTYDKFLDAAKEVAKQTNMVMPDGRPRAVIMDCLNCTNLPARMMDKGIWWTNANGESMLNDPGMKEAAADWMRFHDYWIDIDWGNQVAMVKEGQVLAQFCPDWLYGIHFQGTAEDKEWLADSPMRMTSLPGMSGDSPRTTSWGGTSASVPKLSKIADQAINVLLYVYFENGDGQLAQRFVDTGILPPAKSAWEADVFHKPTEYLGGQIAGEIFIDAAGRLPSYSEQWTTSLVASAWSAQFTAAWAGEMSLDECISAAHEQAIADIEKNKF
ncbi:MAG TPA: ABC transporter substrate-binding protein [Anaerolineae bacterium]|nr:ABC transporter substrate-binding protein [Anaerolineae bacterium]